MNRWKITYMGMNGILKTAIYEGSLLGIASFYLPDSITSQMFNIPSPEVAILKIEKITD